MQCTTIPLANGHVRWSKESSVPESVRIVRVLELLRTQLLHIIYLHKARGHSRASGAARWSLMIVLPGFNSHWMTLICLMLVFKMCQTYRNVETCTLLYYYTASSNFVPSFLSQNVSIQLSNLHHVLSRKSGCVNFCAFLHSGNINLILG